MMAENEAKICCVDGCHAPADGLDDERCQEHWEQYSDRLWWEQLRAATLATAAIKNAKGIGKWQP